MSKEQFFRCVLLSDIVLNASLATEGNMTTLDYIPGANFLGIVAAAVYPDASIEDAQKYHLFHSGKVSFGDAVISDKAFSTYYPKPYSFFKDKLAADKKIYLHYLVDQKNGVKDANGHKIQLKQERSGFLNADGNVIQEIKKTFALKSAQNRETRSSKEGAMFGFESINAEQTFLFSVRYENDADLEIVRKHLVGLKHIGKSKSAQYGLVDIQQVEEVREIDSFHTEGSTLVYAVSNLCFIDEQTGQATFQPTSAQLGLATGEIDWDKSSIRTYSYSPWNYKRNTSNMQRNCIAKGSVFFVKDTQIGASTNRTVGEYQAEGLGRIKYNPVFLKGNSDDWTLAFAITENTAHKKELHQTIPDESTIVTQLGKVLLDKYKMQKADKALSKSIIDAIGEKNFDLDLKSHITSSQWGNIRALATDSINKNENYATFMLKLGFEPSQNGQVITNETGLLTHGKMYDKLWAQNGRLEKLKSILDNYSNQKLEFVAKYAAEMAKLYIDIKNGNRKKD